MKYFVVNVDNELASVAFDTREEAEADLATIPERYRQWSGLRVAEIEDDE